VLTYWAYRVASLLAPVLPRRVGYLLCDFFGELAYRVAKSARRTVRQNLRHVFGGPPPAAAVREVFRSQARNYLDTFVIPSQTARTLPHWAVVDGLEHLEAAHAHGRGVILAGMHLGSPSLAAQVLAQRGWRVNVIVEPIEPPALYELINRHRSGLGIQMVPLNEPSIARRLIRELRANNVLGLMVDRELGENSAAVPFFDAPARLSTGPATLALATGAAVCPSLSLRRPDGLVHGIIEPAIEFARTDDRQADVLALTRRIAERFEYYIGQAPGQWTLFVPVWNWSQESPRC
jgi:phosphatidylinositol dimannoside acyltransferase